MAFALQKQQLLASCPASCPARAPFQPFRPNAIVPVAARQQIVARAAAAEDERFKAVRAKVPPRTTELEQLTLLKRQLETAVADEDYAKAQQLKQQADALKQQLPPVLQYMQHQLDQLKSGSLSEKKAAIQALGKLGSDSCIPGLAACLADPDLNAAAQDAMWDIFHRHPNQEVKALLDRGTAMLEGANMMRYRSALEVFEQACRLAPSYAEAHNKKATVLYLMRQYEESIAACRLVLELNPHHFGAAAGMGMCYIGLEDYASALPAFEAALKINPAMEPIQRYAAALRAKLADGSSGAGNGGSS